MRPHGSTSRGFLTSVVAMVTIALMGQLVVIVLSLSESRAGAAAGTPLIGTFRLTPGSCSGGGATGTYLRMVLSGGTNSAGPYFSNSDSTCSDNTYTPLAPGTAGGLVTGNYQPEPSPAFDSSGNALSNAITAPVAFEGVRFSTSTNPVDPQTSLHVPAPSVVVNGISLSGNLQSFGVSWNDQQFNQGSPKPDGSAPGNTTPVSGAYNPSTGAFTLQWSSQVVGGPFNGFSAFWNLTGRFVPAAGSAAPAPSGAPGAGSAAGTAAGTHGATGATSAGSGAASAGGTNATGASTTGASSAGSTTATSVPSGSAASAGTGAPKAQTIEATRTASSGGPGWQAPNWLIALVTVLAVTGLSGVFLSERALRRARHAGPAT
jgi:hypothetical protein